MNHQLDKIGAILAVLGVGLAMCAADPAVLSAQTPSGTPLPPESNAWFNFEPAKDDFSPTILDCSRWIEAPTSKHGFVTVKGEKFVFEDGTPVRFWGSQTGALRDDPDYSARRMRRQGLNLIRQHGNISNPGRRDDTIARLGENGIYMVLDIYYPLNNRYQASDGIEGWPEGGSSEHVQFFNDKAAAIQQKRLVDFFTHLNPRTGKRWCDDPTLAMIEILNEASMFWAEVDKALRGQVEDKFAAWLRKKYGGNERLRQAWAAGGKSGLDEGEGLDAGQKIALLHPRETTRREHGRQGALCGQPRSASRSVQQL